MRRCRNCYIDLNKLESVKNIFICSTFVTEPETTILLITAKADDIKELISDGIKAGLWKQGWKPDIRGEFQIYLQDKAKYFVKKAKIAKEKARLKKDLESCEDLLESCHSEHFD